LTLSLVMKKYVLLILIVLASGVGGTVGALFSINYLYQDEVSYNSIEQRQQSVLVNYKRDTTYNVPAEKDFLQTAKKATAGVVHIRTSYGAGNFSINPLEFRHDWNAHSSGSGVIISDDGYILTNYHVIEDASNIEVVMNNNQRFFAKVIGVDASTDLALLKVKAGNLPFIPYGDSDRLQLGEWVLAIGNPFDLNSTVTAGIVSAKARNIGILRDRNNLQIESFIQTDAAVNPGNSGGALVNTRGELIGINSAIATSNGSYQGYSFAIPISLAKKVADDLLEFGTVQRGLLGIQISDVNAAVSEALSLSVNQGVLIERVNENSAALEAGLQDGDVITAIEEKPVNSVSELQETVARNRPGKKLQVTYLRSGRKNETNVILRNQEGKVKLAGKPIASEFDGASLADIPYQTLVDVGLEGGVQIIRLKAGKWQEAGIKEKFIIGFIDKLPVNNLEDFNRIMAFKKDGVLIEGFYPDGTKGTYGLAW
jgi:serine protease Do